MVIYYSGESLFPALLAAMKHCRPALGLEQAWGEAISWIEADRRRGERSFLLERFSETTGPGGEIICLAAAGVPPLMFRRTLEGLGGLLEKNCRTPVLPAVYPLPWRRRWEKSGSARRRKACWMDIEAFVERTRLQIELIRAR